MRNNADDLSYWFAHTFDVTSKPPLSSCCIPFFLVLLVCCSDSQGVVDDIAVLEEMRRMREHVMGEADANKVNAAINNIFRV